MSIGMTREVGAGGIPIWQGIGKDIQLAQGGFALVATGLAVNTVIPAGTPFVFDHTTRAATMVGGAILYANATISATTYQVKKGHTLKVGDFFAATSGAQAYAITVIDTSNVLFDTITVGTTLGAVLVAGQNFFASTATGASAAAYPVINALLYDDVLAIPGQSVGLVIRGTVYARRIGFAFSTALSALTGLRFIIFSQSK